MKIILSIVIFCTVLFADRDGGPYIGLGYGVSQYDDDSVYKEKKIDDSTSYNIYGGAYINKHLSVELGYVDFNSGDAYRVVDEQDNEKALSFSSINVSTLAHYAFFDDILDFYGKFGVGQISASGIGTSGFTMIYGAGIGVRFSEMFSMKIAYDIYMIEYAQELEDKKMHIGFAYTALEIQF